MTTDLRSVAERWLAEDPDPATRAELQSVLDANDTAGLADRFGTTLQFGTAGLRGVVGAGPNRMNRAMVLRASAGVGRHLLKAVPESATRGVVIGFDGRTDSARFADDAARVFAALGLKVYLFPHVGPTPLTAYAVKSLHAAAGVMVTASHNPPEYNGYKVYWESGGQIVPPIDEAIAAEIEAIHSLADVPTVELDAARAKGLLVTIAPSLEDDYRRAVEALAVHPGEGAPLKIVYTAMHGVGNKLATAVLARFGTVVSVPEQAEPDGRFPTVKFPNPEEPGAMDLSTALAVKEKADLVLANDPDADRLACAVALGDGRFQMLTGNEIGVLLGHYLLTEQKHASQPLVANSIVSSPLLGAIAAAEGALFAATLTGFKWIVHRGDAICRETGATFVFGYEEALGYCVGSLVRDKDGVSAAYALAELASVLKAKGETLLDRLETIARKYGLYVSGQHNVTLPGAEGQKAIAAMMEKLRANAPKTLDGRAVVGVVDYESGVGEVRGKKVETGLPASNVLSYELEDGSRVMARPSGTEPKIKFYFDQRSAVEAGESIEAARQRAGERLAALKKDFVALIS